MYFLKMRLEKAQILLGREKRHYANLVFHYHSFICGETLEEIEPKEDLKLRGIFLELTCPYQYLTPNAGVVYLGGEDLIINSDRYTNVTLRHPTGDVVIKTTGKGKKIFHENRVLHTFANMGDLRFISMEVGQNRENRSSVPNLIGAYTVENDKFITAATSPISI